MTEEKRNGLTLYDEIKIKLLHRSLSENNVDPVEYDDIYDGKKNNLSSRIEKLTSSQMEQSKSSHLKSKKPPASPNRGNPFRNEKTKDDENIYEFIYTVPNGIVTEAIPSGNTHVYGNQEKIDKRRFSQYYNAETIKKNSKSLSSSREKISHIPTVKQTLKSELDFVQNPFRKLSDNPNQELNIPKSNRTESKIYDEAKDPNDESLRKESLPTKLPSHESPKKPSKKHRSKSVGHTKHENKSESSFWSKTIFRSKSKKKTENIPYDESNIYECIRYKFDEYKSAPWYYNVARTVANDILENKPNGSFLVRPTKNPNYVCTLTVIYNSNVYNLGVGRNEQGRLVLGCCSDNKKTFTTVIDIIDYYTENEFTLNYEDELMYFKLNNISN